VPASSPAPDVPRGPRQVVVEDELLALSGASIVVPDLPHRGWPGPDTFGVLCGACRDLASGQA
jgi:hypothetical protein